MCVGHVTRTVEMMNTYNILVRKPERKRQLGRSMRRWEHNIKIYLRRQVWNVWIGLFWLKILRWRAFVTTTTNLRVPQKSRNFLTEFSVCFARRTLIRRVDVGRGGLTEDMVGSK
jgi:hypothetical protein